MDPRAASLGPRLRDFRLRSGLTVRELARQVNVSPSFVSQIENGKSQPSVSTLYAFSQSLHVSVDDLFDEGVAAADVVRTALVDGLHGLPERSDRASEGTGGAPLSPTADPAAVWRPSEYANRVSIVHPSHRSRLDMAAGVIWERLAATPEREVAFMQIVYEPGASSSDIGEVSCHPGYEYGYVVSGVLEVTIGHEVFTLQAGESLGFDSTIPHTLRNPGTERMLGVWFVHGPV
ncbi:cupin domain-containing protein [Nakamurella deserti]|uniref:cupin domain-containing protein n=1 Tax=Nakamurella deserti TaxID=2164074 RepID=UPI00147929CA|nr:cupin domain-containing protein [Nakamurella deserti]